MYIQWECVVVAEIIHWVTYTLFHSTRGIATLPYTPHTLQPDIASSVMAMTSNFHFSTCQCLLPACDAETDSTLSAHIIYSCARVCCWFPRHQWKWSENSGVRFCVIILLSIRDCAEHGSITGQDSATAEPTDRRKTPHQSETHCGLPSAIGNKNKSTKQQCVCVSDNGDDARLFPRQTWINSAVVAVNALFVPVLRYSGCGPPIG